MKFLGKGRTQKNPAVFVAERTFWFGGREIPQGSICKQWETKNFGWTQWVEPDGAIHIANE